MLHRYVAMLVFMTLFTVLPSASTTCPTDYVIEGDIVDCTCTSNNGNPSGSAVWRIPQGSSRLVLSDVRRGNHSNSYVCEVKWGDRVVRSTTFTLQVACELSGVIGCHGFSVFFGTDSN